MTRWIWLLLALTPAALADDGRPPLSGTAVLVPAGQETLSTYTQGIPALQRSLGKAPTRLVLKGDALPELTCKVLVLLTGHASVAPALDRHAARIHAWIAGGGGLVVFQPNPLVTHPANLKLSKALQGLNKVEQRCRPAFLPIPATFYNWYDRQDRRRIARPDHPIVTGLRPDQVPYCSDRIVDLDKRYQVLVVGMGTETVSLAVASHGAGRIVLCADNITGGSMSRLPTALIARMVAWAAGQPDATVAAIRPDGRTTGDGTRQPGAIPNLPLGPGRPAPPPPRRR